MLLVSYASLKEKYENDSCKRRKKVKIHAQREKLEVVYRKGERSCSKLCYCRGEKKKIIYSFLYVEVIITKEQNIIIAFRKK